MSLPERWFVLRVRVESDGDESDGDESSQALLAQALLEVGGRAVVEEDGWFVTHLPDAAPAGESPEAWKDLLAAEAGLDPAALQVETAWQEHGDWAELWKRGLEPRRLTERIVVTPSWCEPEAREGDIVLVVDPGMAFGNAEHGTTRGCLRLLDGLVREGDRLLDVGAGSAILAIAAARLGAASVRAIEMDELAVPTARENVERNDVEGRVVVEQAKVDAADLVAAGAHDGVIANIEAGYLRPLLGGFAGAVREGGWLLLSGILDHEEASMIAETCAHGFRHVVSDADGEWRSLHFERGS